MKNKIIEVSELKKSFGEVRAVQEISFAVEEGSLFAFLGVNGAGKSTTIDMLCTLLKPDGGEAAISGHRLGAEDDAIRRSIGAVFQEGMLDALLTVRENLQVRGSLYGLSGETLRSASERACRAVQAEEFFDRRYGKLSGGQRRRADIARALIHAPKILFLDEPTTGLDPQTRKKVWEAIQNLRREMGTTVFLTTHYMEEAAQADYITIMGHGQILARGTPFELKREYAFDQLKLWPKEKEKFCRKLAERKIPFHRAGKRSAFR